MIADIATIQTVKEEVKGIIQGVFNFEFGNIFHLKFMWKSFVKNVVRYAVKLTLNPLIFLIFAHI